MVVLANNETIVTVHFLDETQMVLSWLFLPVALHAVNVSVLIGLPFPAECCWGY